MGHKRHKKFTTAEQKLIMAFRGLLRESLISEDSTLQDMLGKVSQDVDETSHLSQFRWEGIDDAFKLKVSGSPYEDAITSAFFQTHNYKYLDDPTFKLSFERELKQRAVPTREIEMAMDHLDSMIAELKDDPAEQDSGWNPDMEDLADLTTRTDSYDSKYTDPFTGGGHYPEGDEFDRGDLEGF